MIQFRNKLPWDSTLSDWRFNRIFRLTCHVGLHMASLWRGDGTRGWCVHCGKEQVLKGVFDA